MKKSSKILLIISFLLIILISIYFIGYYVINNKKKEGVAVLAYHHFMSEKEKAKYEKENYWVISTEKFEEQMKYLSNNGYNCITPEQLMCYMKNECKIPEKSFIITIDDGNISSYYKALPILEKYNINSINFIITSRVGDNTADFNPSQYNFLGRDKLDEIKKEHKTMTIGAHSHNLHELINGANPVEVKTYDEVLEDVKLAKNNLYNTSYYAYPFGGKTDKYEKTLKASGYEAAFTYKDNRKATQNDNLFAIPRIEIRGDQSLNDFIYKINEKVTLKQYTKNIIKKIFNIK